MKKKKWVINIAMIVCILVFAGCGIYLLRYYMGVKQTENELDELLKMKNEGVQTADDSEDVKTAAGRKVMKQYKKLYKKNTDLVGWITVKNTKIDYPVMQTPKEPEFYLHKNYKKEQDVNGLPFLDAKCDVEDKESNLMVYGHHMKSGMMFAHLVDYDSKDFYKKHKTVIFDTLYEEREYEVVAAFYSKIYKENEDVFKYYNYPGHLSKKQYDKYVTNIKKLSRYDTGITPKYGEQLLTMVTCAYQTEDGRFVVVARRKG